MDVDPELVEDMRMMLIRYPAGTGVRIRSDVPCPTCKAALEASASEVAPNEKNERRFRISYICGKCSFQAETGRSFVLRKREPVKFTIPIAPEIVLQVRRAEEQERDSASISVAGACPACQEIDRLIASCYESKEETRNGIVFWTYTVIVECTACDLCALTGDTFDVREH